MEDKDRKFSFFSEWEWIGENYEKYTGYITEIAENSANLVLNDVFNSGKLHIVPSSDSYMIEFEYNDESVAQTSLRKLLVEEFEAADDPVSQTALKEELQNILATLETLSPKK